MIAVLALQSRSPWGQHVVFHICRALVECAEAEGRVVLTADRTFIAGRYCEASYFIRGADKKAQLQEVRVSRR